MHFRDKRLELDATERFQKSSRFRDALETCNAYSLSAALGLPYESVRRKLIGLQRRGWIVRGKDRGVRITPKLARHFQPDFNFRLMTNLLKTAGRIEKLLED